MLPCSPWRALVLALGLWCLFVARAEAVVCDKPPDVNPIKFGCSPLSQTCTITAGSAPEGCELDFGTRKVIFQGNFDVANTTLIIRARQIEVKGALKARADNNQRGGTIRVTALESIVVSGTIDTSGNSAGLMRLQAGTLIDLTSTAILRARGIETSSTGNSASGGSIELVSGTSLTHRGTIDLGGGPGGGGGTLLTQNGTTILIAQPIDATGGANDGGDIDLLAGDDITIEKSINVSSTSGGGGGDIRVRAGVDRVGGVKVGGTLIMSGDLTADGNNDIDGGYDGGEISLAAFGPVTVTGALRSVAGNPDGGGGNVIIDSSDNVIGRVTAFDGDLTLDTEIDVHGPRTSSGDNSGSGGDVDIFIGRDGTINGTMDLSGSDGGGALNLTGGRTVQFGAAVNASGTATFASGGSVAMRTGLGSLGTLSVTRTLDVSANVNGLNGDVTLASCGLSTAPGLTINASSGSANGTPRVDLISKGTMTIGAGGVYRADPLGRIALVHPLASPPAIGANVTFSPQMVHVTDNPALFPTCAVCGDGIRQVGEPCDKGTAADGACCNADCTGFSCPTRTPTPTVTATSTGPTRSPTPTRTKTPTPTRTPNGIITATPLPQPTVTALPLIEPKAVLTCEKTLGKATTTITLTALKTLEACALESFKCVQTRPEGPDRAACFTTIGRRCTGKLAKLELAHAKFRTQFTTACGGDPPVVPNAVMRSTDLLGFALLQPQCFQLDLTSPDEILGCLQIISPCAAQRALGIGIPRVTDLIAFVADIGDDGDCLPSPTGESGGLAGSPVTGQTIRCQRTIATSGRKLVTRQLNAARSCVDGLLKCRLSGKPREACERVGASCQRKLAALDEPSSGARAKMLAAIHNACGPLPNEVLLELIGLGFEVAADRCTALGVAAPTDVDSAATCVTRAYGCAGSAITRQALPLVDRELARFGIELGNDAFCALPTPTATTTPVPTTTPTSTITSTPPPTLTPTPTATSTEPPTPTVTPTATATPAETATGATPTPTPVETATPEEPVTPTPSPTPGCPSGIVDPGEQCDYGDDVAGDGCDPFCRFELLIPGGGASTTNDCIAEWAVVNPLNNPPPPEGEIYDFRQFCVDGDPSCDADGEHDDKCTYRVAVCLVNADPNIPDCTAPPGIAKYVLVSPRPDSSEPGDAANALALIESFTRVSPVAPSGDSANTLEFEPPLQLTAPDNCTEPFHLVVERRGYPARSEKFRANATSGPLIGVTQGTEDSDTLILNCLESPEPTATPTPTP